MSFRTVIIKNRAKLDFSMNYLVYRSEKIHKIHISEISVLIIESPAVAVTATLLNQLVANKVKVVFCDDKHMPSSQLMPFHDNYHSSKMLQQQMQWDDNIKHEVWQNIVKHKILAQRRVLCNYQHDGDILLAYAEDVERGDSTNREGHSAKVYFNMLFDMLHRRVPCFNNQALNYGYAILLSAFCRDITASGYVTELGIWHNNQFNFYNLACDLMETFRPIVDACVLTLDREDFMFKSKMANITNCMVHINNKKVYLETAISIYCDSVFRALNMRDASLIINYTNYELPIYENTNNV